MKSKKLNTKNKILVLGGSKGIGRSIVDEFLQKNYNVYSISRSSPNLNHINFHPLIGDLLDSLFVQELSKKIEKECRHVFFANVCQTQQAR